MRLTKDEKDYLADKVFWDWKRAEIDTWSASFLGADKGEAKRVEDFYKNLYKKLGGKVGISKRFNHRAGASRLDDRESRRRRA